MKTVLYLIQTKAGLPAIYECLKTRNFLILSYKEQTPETTIYAPNTTWTEGRNLLHEYVREKNLLYDYYAFMDEDIVFKKASFFTENVLFKNTLASGISRSPRNFATAIMREQQAGFESLEESLELGYPIVVMKFGRFRIADSVDTAAGYKMFYMGRYMSVNKDWVLQTATYFDAICNAISKDVLFADTILPYTEKYDSSSWWLSQFIFISKANYHYCGQILQNNQYTILNTQCIKYPRNLKIFENMATPIYYEICAEYGVDAILADEAKEVDASHIPTFAVNPYNDVSFIQQCKELLPLFPFLPVVIVTGVFRKLRRILRKISRRTE